MKTFRQYHKNKSSQLDIMSGIRRPMPPPSKAFKSKKLKILDREHRKAMRDYDDI